MINGLEHEREEKGGMMEVRDTEEEVEGRGSTWTFVILYINKHFLFRFTFYSPRASTWPCKVPMQKRALGGELALGVRL